MPVYIRPCSRCESTKSRVNRTDRKGRKKCPDCYYQAVAPPSVGRRSLGTFRTKEEADAAMRRALTDHERGIDLAPRATTVAQIAERFFKATKADLAPATFARYGELWKLHLEPTLGAMLSANVKPVHVAELYAKLRSEPIVYRHQSKAKGREGSERERIGKSLSANSVLRIHRLLHRMFGWAERMNLTARNVIRSVEAPKATPSPARALSVDHVAKLLKAAEGTRLHGFFVTAAMTGMRRGEIGALTWDAIDLEAGTAVVRQAIGDDRRGGSFVKSTKSGRARTLPLNGTAVAAIRAQRAMQAQEQAAEPRTLRRTRARLCRSDRERPRSRPRQQGVLEAGA